MRDLKVGVAAVVSFGIAQDKTDGVMLETGLATALDHATTGIKLSKNGGAMTIRHATVTATTYDSYGQYLVTLDTTDINTLGHLLAQYVDPATNLPMWAEFNVLTADEWDRKYSDVGPVPSLGIVDRGTVADLLTTTTKQLRSAAAFGTNTLANCILAVKGSTNAPYWQYAFITSNTNAAGANVVTYPAFPVEPTGAATVYQIHGIPAANPALLVPASLNSTERAAIHAAMLDGFIAWLQDTGFTRPTTTGNATLKNSTGAGQTVAITTDAAALPIISAT